MGGLRREEGMNEFPRWVRKEGQTFQASFRLDILLGWPKSIGRREAGGVGKRPQGEEFQK